MLKVIIEVDARDVTSINDAIDVLTSLPGFYRFSKGGVADAPDAAPVPLATAIEEARAETAATEADAITALSAYVKSKGVPSAIALLAEFGVARVTELHADSRAAFIAKTAVTEAAA